MTDKSKIRKIINKLVKGRTFCKEIEMCPGCQDLITEIIPQLSTLNKIDPIKMAEIIDDFVEKGTYQQLKDTGNLVTTLIQRKSEWIKGCEG